MKPLCNPKLLRVANFLQCNSQFKILHVVLFFTFIFRKGKEKAFDIVEKDASGCYLDLFKTMSDPCSSPAQAKAKDVNEARYNKLIQMTGKIDQVSLKVIEEPCQC